MLVQDWVAQRLRKICFFYKFGQGRLALAVPRRPCHVGASLLNAHYPLSRLYLVHCRVRALATAVFLYTFLMILFSAIVFNIACVICLTTLSRLPAN